MFNDPESQTSDQEDAKLQQKLNQLTGMTIVLSFLRLLSFDIMLMFSDLLNSLLVYFYAQSRNKCMAIFCGINGIIGLLYALIKLYANWSAAGTNWFSFYYNILVLVAIYAILVYTMMIYYAYLGYNKYDGMTMSMPTSSQQASYGVINNQNSEAKFSAFSGRGTTIG